MTFTKTQSQQPVRRIRPRSLFEILMALIVLANYIIVIFDLTYIPLRDFWLQGKFQITLVKYNHPLKIGNLSIEEVKIPPKEPWQIPGVTVVSSYDEIKGIQPYRSTKTYLEKVDELTAQISQAGLQSSQPIIQKNIDRSLADLRKQSREIIDTNPFQIANKTGTLEKIKNEMREHIFGTSDASAKEAFDIFWSREYLSNHDLNQELDFFNQKIRPLIETNYYRPVAENGQPIDNFKTLDFLFLLIFLPEFLLRTWWISRSHTRVSWFDAMLWRWYDIFLLIPVFRWLRIIPVTIRLHRAGLINLHRIQHQASQGFVYNIGKDLTEVVLVTTINRFQYLVIRGELRKFIHQSSSTQYIDINNTNEIAEIIKMVAQTMIKEVFPKIQPDAEAFLKYNIKKAIEQTPAYKNLHNLPGMKRLQNQLSENLAKQTCQAFSGIADSLITDDPTSNQLLEKLITDFTQTLETELKTQHSLDKLECLVVDFLEEVKINYVQNLSQEEVEIIIEQAKNSREKVQTLPQLQSRE